MRGRRGSLKTEGEELTQLVCLPSAAVKLAPLARPSRFSSVRDTASGNQVTNSTPSLRRDPSGPQRVLRDSVRAQFECGLWFRDSVGGAPVLVHLFFPVVELTHIGVVCFAGEADVLRASVSADSVGFVVVELQSVTLGATLAVGAFVAPRNVYVRCDGGIAGRSDKVSGKLNERRQPRRESGSRHVRGAKETKRDKGVEKVIGLRPRCRAHPCEVDQECWGEQGGQAILRGFLLAHTYKLLWSLALANVSVASSTRSSFSDTATSMIEARSLPGMSASSRLSLSRSSSLAVNATL